jgi:gluconokinase
VASKRRGGRLQQPDSQTDAPRRRDAKDSPSKAPLAVIVMGVSGCGKSTLGAQLAGMLDAPFLEGDAFHDPAAIAKMRAGKPLTDEDRWPWLDRLGLAIGEALGAHGAAVAACSALRGSYRQRLRDAVGGPICFVLLDNSREELMRRMTGRPDHYMPASLLDSQLSLLERPEAYETATVLDGAGSTEALCEAAMAWLEVTRRRL